MSEKKRLTGYPSIDRPWLKYYSEEAIQAEIPHMTLYQYAYENNKDCPDNTAFRYYGTKITYGQFFERVRQTAKAFRAMGIRENDTVTIMSMHTPETIYVMYALNYIGAVSNMVYMTLAGKEIVDAIEHTESKIFFVLDQIADRIAEIGDAISVPVVVLSAADSMPRETQLLFQKRNTVREHSFETFSEFLKKAEGAGDFPCNGDSEKLAVIVYTSGTTGKPKGVMLSSDNLNAVAWQAMRTDRNDRRGETALHNIPIFLGFGLGMLCRFISHGLNIDLCIVNDVGEVGKKFNESKPNRFVTGPPFVDGVMEHTEDSLEGLIEFTGGGAKIETKKEEELNRFLKDHGSSARYLNGYGMTEFASAVMTNWNSANRTGSLGIPFVKVNIRIIDADGNECRCGETGEMCVSAPNMMIGYYKNEAETEKTP